MQLAMYKGPASGFKNKVGRLIVCAFTFSRYSHCELVIEGYGYSSSFMDGGVRKKLINFGSGHWDLYDIDASALQLRALGHDLMLERFAQELGKPYDWIGMLRVSPLLRWLPRRDAERFCSEEVAYLLGASDPERFSPIAILRTFGRRKQ